MATPHISAEKGDFAKTVLMPGDPLRAKFIADTFLEDVRQVTGVRGMLGFTGTYEGRPISVMGSGMGMPSIGIYSYELYKFYDVDNIIRIGSAGSYTDKAKLFDVVLAAGAVSESNYARVQSGFEGDLTLPSQTLNDKLRASAAKQGIPLIEGNIHSSVKYSDATLEWYQQAENFEAYCVGKTADEIAGIETKVNEEGYNVAVDETLYASCSISIEDFIGAVVKACSDEKGQTFKASGELKLGLAAITTAAESTPATDTDPAAVKMYTDFGATVVGADGKILAAITDSIQPVVNADKEGKIVDSTFKGTKRELGSDYGMVAYGNAIAEWDAQAQAFANYTVGKTADEVRAIETTQNDHGYSVTADETLYASCTMQITGMMAVLAQAADYAR